MTNSGSFTLGPGESTDGRRCEARYTDDDGTTFRCEARTAPEATYVGVTDHWARVDGRKVTWTDAVAIYPLVPDSYANPTEIPVPASCRQVDGDHYRKHAIQPWDIIDEYNLSFYEGSALKYLLRTKSDRLEDLKKARHYLDKLIEIEEGKGG